MFRTDPFVSDQVILREQTLSGNKNLNIPQEDPSSLIKHSPISTEAQLRACLIDTQSTSWAWGMLMLTDFSGTEWLWQRMDLILFQL